MLMLVHTRVESRRGGDEKQQPTTFYHSQAPKILLLLCFVIYRSLKVSRQPTTKMLNSISNPILLLSRWARVAINFSRRNMYRGWRKNKAQSRKMKKWKNAKQDKWKFCVREISMNINPTENIIQHSASTIRIHIHTSTFGWLQLSNKTCQWNVSLMNYWDHHTESLSPFLRCFWMGLSQFDVGCHGDSFIIRNYDEFQ